MPTPKPSPGSRSTVAGRAGLDPVSSDHLRRLMSDWSERFRRRLSSQQQAVPDAAFVALTVSYLRRLRKGEHRRASRG
ncbi:MAG: hypothetical protein LC796_14465 [Acidobacteria bacterium]|nr:hypothetical protein [Acidobacteriota bacterium]